MTQWEKINKIDPHFIITWGAWQPNHMIIVSICKGQEVHSYKWFWKCWWVINSKSYTKIPTELYDLCYEIIFWEEQLGHKFEFATALPHIPDCCCAWACDSRGIQELIAMTLFCGSIVGRRFNLKAAMHKMYLCSSCRSLHFSWICYARRRGFARSISSARYRPQMAN